MKQQTEMEYHVTSLVVHAAPGTLEAVTTAIQPLKAPKSMPAAQKANW